MTFRPLFGSARRMRIGIDGGCLSNRRGFGRFSRELLRALAQRVDPARHQVSVFVDRPSLALVEVPAPFQTVAVDVREAPSRAASAEGRRKLGDLFAMGHAVSRSRLNLMYFPASYSFFPVWNVSKVVTTLHDTLALAHPELVFNRWRGKLAWKAKEHAAVAWSDRIVTVSESARRDLIAWFRLDPARVTAITEGPDAIFSPRPSGESAEVLRRFGLNPAKRYVLYVGGLSPHKNLIRLIEAFRSVVPEDVPLVLVGDFGDVFQTHVPQLREAVARHGLERRVLFTGYVDDPDLAHLYSRAYALVQPSLMEGFGLPAVEAMACGTPVISSTAGSLPEVVGDAGVFFNPLDVSEMAAKLNGLLADPRERSRLAKLAKARAASFSWDRAAGLLLDIFEDLAGDGAEQDGRARASA